MEEIKLLASAAVLRALYDERNDIYDVLVEFIKAIIGSRSLSAFSSTDCVNYLEKDFGFCLPEAVVKSCLRRRLVKAGFLNLQNGMYSVSDSFESNSEFEIDFQESRTEYDEIIRRIHEFCSNKGVLDIPKGDIEEGLELYLTRPDKNNKYGGDIANFIVTFENEEGFQDKLSRIEEGLILYAGIRYSPDLSTLGSWRGNLTVFLDAEHLFNASGLNGELYKFLFDDFYSLVREVNRNKKGGKIELRYLSETESDIESFFYAAQKIVERKSSIDPSKTAMINICNGCKFKSEVLTKKAEFMTNISRLGITKESCLDYYSKPEFNVEGSDVVDNIFSDLKGANISKDDVALILRIFTKINFIRKGKNDIGIDGVESIFMTESWLPQRMAFSDHVFEGNGAIPFATNIEFLTERLWFKLNKGFGDGARKPASFDPVIRAKLTISSQISKSVSNIYKSLSEKYEKGEIDKEVVARIHYEIYRAPSRPEDVSTDSISMSKDFLNDSYIEKVVNEKAFLERKASEGEMAIEELRRINHEKRIEKRAPIKSIAVRQYVVLRFLTYIFIPATCILLLISFYSASDSVLSIVFGLIGLVGVINGIVRPKKIDQCYWRLSRAWYRKSINEALQRTSR